MSKSVGTAQRSCFACRDKGEKSTMLRVVVDAEGMIWPDLMQKAPGRGAYLCMQQGCLDRLSDKRLGALRQKFEITLPQWNDLKKRVCEALKQQSSRWLTRQQRVAAVGRDAVMHRMWKNGAMLVLLASDAGEALIRQVEDAVEKRGLDKQKTLLNRMCSTMFLAESFSREKVSVVALSRPVGVEKWQQTAVWYERMVGVKNGKMKL